eukprot:scaffold15919_cov90-Cyclotella_meneghiniana.AAC.2
MRQQQNEQEAAKRKWNRSEHTATTKYGPVSIEDVMWITVEFRRQFRRNRYASKSRNCKKETDDVITNGDSNS